MVEMSLKILEIVTILDMVYPFHANI